MKYISLLSLFLVSCASIGGQKQIYQESNPEFDKYVDDFAKQHEKFLGSYPRIDVPINFHLDEEFQSKTVQNGPNSFSTTVHGAQCRIYTNELGIETGKEILINPERWERYGESTRRAKIFHELGHCFLGREAHDDAETETNISRSTKLSIMHTDVTNTLYYDGHSRLRDRTNFLYLKELFTGDKSGWDNL